MARRNDMARRSTGSSGSRRTRQHRLRSPLRWRSSLLDRGLEHRLADRCSALGGRCPPLAGRCPPLAGRCPALGGPCRPLAGRALAAGTTGSLALGSGLEEEDRPGHRRVERIDGSVERDPNEEVAPPAHDAGEPPALAANDDRQGPAEVGFPIRQRRLRLGPHDPKTADVEVGEGRRQVVDRSDEEMLGRSGRCLHRGRAQRRLAPLGDDNTVDAGPLGAPEEGAKVLGVLEGVEDEDEGWLSPLDGPGEDLVETRRPPRSDDESDPLVAIETGDGRQDPTLDLDDRDPEADGMEDEILEGLPPVGNDEEAACSAAGDEGLPDRPPTGDDLVVGTDELAEAVAGRTPA